MEPGRGSVEEPLEHTRAHAGFDFRSAQFVADAQTLARASGRPLALCREQLFIAEGDMVQAFEWLRSGYSLEVVEPVLH